MSEKVELGEFVIVHLTCSDAWHNTPQGHTEIEPNATCKDNYTP